MVVIPKFINPRQSGRCIQGKHVASDLFLLILLATCSLFVGCATMVSGSSQTIRIVTDPADAKAIIFDKNGVEVETSNTPAELTVNRGDGYFQGTFYRIVITKDGFKESVFDLTPGLNSSWYLAGNLPFSIVGWFLVDPITGAMWSLRPSGIRTILTPLNSSTESNDGFVGSLNLDENQEEQRSYSPVLAGVSGIFPGGGYYYLGDYPKGFLTTGAAILAQGAMFALGTGGQSNSPAFWGSFAGLIGIYAFSIGDGVLIALKRSEKK